MNNIWVIVLIFNMIEIKVYYIESVLQSLNSNMEEESKKQQPQPQVKQANNSKAEIPLEENASFGQSNTAPAKKELIQKAEDKDGQENKIDSLENQARKVAFNERPHITEQILSKFVAHLKEQKLSPTKEIFLEWQSKNTKQNKQKPSQQSKQKVKDSSSQQKKQQPQKPKQQIQKQKKPEQLCEQFFLTFKPGDKSDTKSKIIHHLNHLIQADLPIYSAHITKYFGSKQENYSFADFKEWIVKHHEEQTTILIQKLKASPVYGELLKHQENIHKIVSLASKEHTSLNVNLNFGENKGKTNLKYGLSFKEKAEEHFSITIQAKIKKKIQLKSMIENELKKIYKSDQYHIFKLAKLSFKQTDKSLIIHVTSKILQKTVLMQTIDSINKLFTTQSQKPILNLQGELTIKNSIRNQQTTLQGKRLPKWLGQGFNKTLKIEGNTKLIQHFTSPFADIFPILKVVRSGDVLLKLKNTGHIEKLFQKLGISEIVEETPTLSAFLMSQVKEYLSSSYAPFISELVKKILTFTCTIPNEKIAIDLGINLSHFSAHISLATQACKQLAEIIKATSEELFS